MTVVFAGATSHAPGIVAWTEQAEKQQADRVFAAYESLRGVLADSKPDTILLLTSEHWVNFFLNHVGAFCLGRGDTFQGPVEPWLRVQRRTLQGNPPLATVLLEHCYANGFELDYSYELELDHGSMVPLNFLMPSPDVKVLPLMFNTLATPRPSARRCFQLGEVLREALETSGERVAVVATGGLSHDPGERNHGFIDIAFDQQFLRDISGPDLERLRNYTDAELLKAGAGTLELLAWICLAGIMSARPCQVIGYEPVAAWATGVGVIAYNDHT